MDLGRVQEEGEYDQKNTLYEILNELIKLIKFKRSFHNIAAFRKHQAEQDKQKPIILSHLYMDHKIYK